MYMVETWPASMCVRSAARYNSPLLHLDMSALGYGAKAVYRMRSRILLFIPPIRKKTRPAVRQFLSHMLTLARRLLSKKDG